MPVIEQKTTNKNKVDFDLNRLDKSKTTIFSKYPKLYSLNKFMARFDKKVEKDYLLGRYGAIPIFRQVALEPGALEEGEQSAESS